MVGRACDTDHWLVIHKPTGLICYEANEDGSRFVNSPVLLVEPESLAKAPVMPEAVSTQQMVGPASYRYSAGRRSRTAA